jgi:hypothetical protein
MPNRYPTAADHARLDHGRPSTIPGGSDAAGTATFTAPTVDGAVLNISSSDTAVARVPAQTVVVRGATTGAFDIATSAVAAPTPVTITVTSFGVTRTTAITVTPDPLPAPDTVTIRKAECKVQNNGCLVSVETTSSNPDAILGVYSSGVLQFTLTNNGGGRYSGSRGFTDDPRTIEVRSNFRGSAVATNL